jgi:hypothetical protein
MIERRAAVTAAPATAGGGQEALDAFQLLTRVEGIIPALEPAHVLAFVSKLAPTLPKDNLLVKNLCGRGAKDIFAVAVGSGSGGGRLSRLPSSISVGKMATSIRWSALGACHPKTAALAHVCMPPSRRGLMARSPDDFWPR